MNHHLDRAGGHELGQVPVPMRTKAGVEVELGVELEVESQIECLADDRVSQSTFWIQVRETVNQECKVPSQTDWGGWNE